MSCRFLSGSDPRVKSSGPEPGRNSIRGRMLRSRSPERFTALLAERDEIVLQFRPLAYRLARDFFDRSGRSLSYDDLLGEALLSLVDAVELYTPGRHGTRTGVAAGIKTYLHSFISGRLIREAKQHHVAHRLPPSLVRADDSSLPEGIRRRVQAGRFPMSLDQLSRVDGGFLQSRDGAQSALDPDEREVLLACLSLLPWRWRRVLELRVGQGLKLHEVGHLLCMSKERVRQIAIQGIGRLRVLLERKGFGA